MGAARKLDSGESARVEDLRRRLRQLRIDSGMSQSDVGASVGLSRSAVTQIEKGNRDVSADELIRFAAAFRQSPSSLIAGLGGPGAEHNGDRSGVIEEILAGCPALARSSRFRDGLEDLLRLARSLTEIETQLGSDVYGPEAFVFRGTPPRSSWEAAHQGYAAAEDERRRLDLGSTPIRDMAEMLATVGVRAVRLPLPEATSGLFVQSRETGAIVVVNESASLAEQRFWLAHGFAHVLFDSERRWIVCRQDERGHHHEVRANAFASRFLLPASGIERYLQSIGRDTMAQVRSSALDLLSDTAAISADDSRVHLSGRARRGAWQLNAYELAQIAHYFGASTSLVAHALRNLGILSVDERDRLTDIHGVRQSDRARDAMRFGDQAAEGGFEPFVSRLVALATEARRRGVVAAEKFEFLAELLDLDERAKSLLLSE